MENIIINKKNANSIQKKIIDASKKIDDLKNKYYSLLEKLQIESLDLEKSEKEDENITEIYNKMQCSRNDLIKDVSLLIENYFKNIENDDDPTIQEMKKRCIEKYKEMFKTKIPLEVFNCFLKKESLL